MNAVEFLLDGKLRIVRPLGRGGFGIVYEAEEVAKPGIRLAVKIVQPPPDVEGFELRFLREVKNAQRLRHPHAVKVIEHGSLTDGRLWYTMELCPGRSLRAILTEEGALAPARAVRLALQALEALGAAHRMDMVHRDVKPENVQVTAGPDGREVAKVLDFGLAKIGGGRASQDLSATGQVSGTVRYMAPEQLHGEAVDGRADIYSAAATLFEVLVGRPPFDARNEWSLIRQVVSEDAPDASKLAGGRVPGALGAAIRKALEKRVDDRFATAEAFAAALLAAVPEAASPESCPPARESTRPVPVPGASLVGDTETEVSAAPSRRFFPVPLPGGPVTGTPATALQDPPLLGRYLLRGRIAEGRHGPLFEALDLEDGGRVAVKVLEKERAATDEDRRRFFDGVPPLLALRHPNLVAVCATGATPGGVPFVVHEWAPGHALDRAVERGPLPLDQAAGALCQLLDGLAAVHAAGLVHRDVAAEHLLVHPEPGNVRIRLFGFRAATSVISSGGGTSRVGSAMGAARYLSPEQLRGEPLDARSDLFSAGVILFELLAGRPPWEGERTMDVMKPILFGATPQLPADVPHETRAAAGPIVARALAKARDDRYASAAAMRAALAPLAGRLEAERFAAREPIK